MLRFSIDRRKRSIRSISVRRLMGMELHPVCGLYDPAIARGRQGSLLADECERYRRPWRTTYSVPVSRPLKANRRMEHLNAKLGSRRPQADAGADRRPL